MINIFKEVLKFNLSASACVNVDFPTPTVPAIVIIAFEEYQNYSSILSQSLVLLILKFLYSRHYC